MEIDAIGEILNISLGTSATSVSELLGQPVKITTPKVKVMKTKNFNIKTYEPAIGVEINYVKGLDGQNILILKESDVKVIVGLLLQTDFSDREFVMDEMNIGAICEVMNQMMGASATALSQFLNRAISISPPNSFSIDNTEQFKNKYFPKDEDIVAVYFNLMIGKLVNSQFINVMRTGLAKELISNFGLESMAPASAPVPPAAPAPAPDPKPASAPA
ncbi:MAG TPA: flagellar motor switch phosphatase FliY, partial [Ruminococcaceae bacterium]|nr:flagellar motor switch phosphatase FliY [Oscillospiraceae bacterium]